MRSSPGGRTTKWMRPLAQALTLARAGRRVFGGLAAGPADEPAPVGGLLHTVLPLLIFLSGAALAWRSDITLGSALVPGHRSSRRRGRMLGDFRSLPRLRKSDALTGALEGFAALLAYPVVAYGRFLPATIAFVPRATALLPHDPLFPAPYGLATSEPAATSHSCVRRAGRRLSPPTLVQSLEVRYEHQVRFSGSAAE